MRFNKNQCNRCVEYCTAGAIRIDEGGLNIFRDVCTECMLCVSECPSNGFEINGKDFYLTIAGLKNIQSPVLGCNVYPDLVAHEKVFCLGCLSEEHFAVLSVLIGQPLQINLTECAKCRNGFIVGILKKRLKDAGTKISIRISEKIRFVEKKAGLDYCAISYNRRDFFKVLKKLTIQGTSNLLENADAGENPLSYADKTLPVKRVLLNNALSGASGKIKEEILDNYYYDLRIDEPCNHCFACVAMCPTGALKNDRPNSEKRLLFNSSRCNGCGLCVSFCMKNAINIKNGPKGYNPFEFNLRYYESKEAHHVGR